MNPLPLRSFAENDDDARRCLCGAESAWMMDETTKDAEAADAA